MSLGYSNRMNRFFCIAKHKRRSFHAKTGKRSERKAKREGKGATVQVKEVEEWRS
jgi:hypothetical protein